MTNCLDNFILCKNLCRGIEPSNWIVTVSLRKKPQSLLVYLKKLFENRIRHRLWRSYKKTQNKQGVRIYSWYWVKQYNCYCLFENITACSCLWLDGHLKYRFNWSRLNRKHFQLKPFDFVLVNFDKKISSQRESKLYALKFFLVLCYKQKLAAKNYFSVRSNMKRYKLRLEGKRKFENR